MNDIEEYEKYIKKQDMLGTKMFEFRVDLYSHVVIKKFIQNEESERIVRIPEFVSKTGMEAFEGIKQKLRIISRGLSYVTFSGYQADKLDIFRLDTSDIENMSCMFEGCDKLREIDLSSFNTSKVKSIEFMFYNCSKLEELKLKSFNTDNVANMCGVFLNCKGLKEIDLSSFRTNKVKTMSSMFSGCESLKKLDLSNFDTEKVESISTMFAGCINLEEVDLSNFDIRNVESMGYMFKDCYKLKVIKTNLCTAKIFNLNRENLRLHKECKIEVNK